MLVATAYGKVLRDETGDGVHGWVDVHRSNTALFVELKAIEGGT